jgi:hypothetical protein
MVPPLLFDVRIGWILDGMEERRGGTARAGWNGEVNGVSIVL